MKLYRVFRNDSEVSIVVVAANEVDAIRQASEVFETTNLTQFKVYEV